MDKQIFQERLKTVINEKGIQIKELSKITGISKSSLYEYLNSEHMPTLNHVYLICKHLNINPAWIMGLSDEKKKDNTSVDYKTLQSFMSSANQFFLDNPQYKEGVDNNKTLLNFYDTKTNHIIVITLVTPSNPLYQVYSSRF